ncbi:MAG: SAM-dependent methyltransferase [Bryobacteraceae bacterium]
MQPSSPAAASYIRTLGCDTIVELGSGRAEMGAAFSCFRYIPVDLRHGSLPVSFSGVLFSNEFFDALPVDLHLSSGEEVRVDFDGSRFEWSPPLGDGIVESQSQRLAWLDRIATALQSGYVITIDYGYTREELVRFPQGTLMSYRKHTALADVLEEPGERDITAHVAFTDLMEHGNMLGLRTILFETLAQFVLRIGGADNFESALAADTELEGLKLRLQLKAILFGMGEGFRVLVQHK